MSSDASFDERLVQAKISSRVKIFLPARLSFEYARRITLQAVSELHCWL